MICNLTGLCTIKIGDEMSELCARANRSRPKTLISTISGPLRSIPIIILYLAACCGSAAAVDFSAGPVEMEIGGTVEFSGVIPFSKQAPSEDPCARLVFDYNAVFSSAAEFTARLEGLYDGSVKNPSNSSPFAAWDEVFPDQNPYVELDEAYVSLFLGMFDIRAGVQKFSWGTLDEINPTDNLCPKDFRHPFGLTSLEQKIGVPSVDVSFYPSFDDIEIKGVWIPFWVPYRMSDQGERWYPPLFEAPETMDIRKSLVEEMVEGLIPPGFIDWALRPAGDTLQVEITQTNDDSDRPPRSLSHSAFAFKLARTIGSVDLSVSYFNGYDPKPVFGAEGRVLSEVGFRPSKQDIFLYDLTLYPFHRRIQVFGADAATARGAFTFRAEAAYFKGRYINIGLQNLDKIIEDTPGPESLDEIDLAPRSGGGLTMEFPFNPRLTFQKDVVSAGAGMDYQWGSYIFSLQAVLDHILDYRDEPLVFEEYEVMVTLGLHATFLNDALAVEGGLGINPAQNLLLFKSRADYLYSDNISFGLDIVLLDGSLLSPFGQFSKNDQIGLRVSYSF